jgi:hypothetical protein
VRVAAAVVGVVVLGAVDFGTVVLGTVGDVVLDGGADAGVLDEGAADAALDAGKPGDDLKAASAPSPATVMMAAGMALPMRQWSYSSNRS